MAKLTIEGQTIEIDDAFLDLSPDEQNATVTKIAEQIGAKPKEPGFAKIGQGRAEGVNVLRGIPIAGAYADKAAAALNAAAEPVMSTGLSKAPSFGERMSENERLIREGADAYAREKPIAAMAEQFAGGTAALAPLAASQVAARALGMSGTLPQMVTRGGISGAAIGGADALARGNDPTGGAAIGGVTGAGFPVIARGIGKVADVFRTPPAAPPAPRMRPKTTAAGVEIPRFESQVTGDPTAGDFEQQAISGALGKEPQRLALQALEERTAATNQLRSNISGQMSPATDPRLAPGGAAPEVPLPGAAAETAIDDLAARQAAEEQRRALSGVAAEVSDFQLRAPAPGTLPSTAMEAADIMGGRIRTAATEAAQGRTQAYQRAGEVEGTYNPAAWERVSASLEQRLNSGAPEQRVRVNNMTPNARQALDIIESELGSGRRPANDVSPQIRGYNAAVEEGARPRPAPPITPRDVEAVRQQLVPLVADARNASRAPGGSAADYRAMRRLMDAFDQHERDVIAAGGFSGDGAELLRRKTAARAAHAAYRGNFSARGQGDVVGPVIEKIIGKHPGQEMQPDAISSAFFGGGAGGGNTVANAQRARAILGPDSQEWQAAKQGFLSSILDVPQGTTPLTPLEQAERIYNAVNGKGAALTQVYLTPDEIGRLTQHADLLRNLFPRRGPLNSVEKQIARLSGADGSPPATSRDLLGMIMNDSGLKPGATPLLSRLKETLSPESWDSVRQSVWRSLVEVPEGMLEMGPQKLSQRLHKLLADPAAPLLYSAQERQLMKILADEYKSQIPLPNTTNPSGSGIFATKMVNAVRGNLLPMLGMTTHGAPGVVAGAAAEKALAFVTNRRNVERTKDLFYGRTAPKTKIKSVPGLARNHERAAAILAKAAQPLITPAPSAQTGQ